SSTATRAVSVATIAADPITPPTWRVVLNAPAPAPAVRSSRPEVARLASGENTQPVPMPNSVMGSTTVTTGTSGPTTAASQPIATARTPNPVATTHLAGTRSDSRPASGAMIPDTSDPGRLTSAAFSGDRPRMDCRKIVSGKKIP